MRRQPGPGDPVHHTPGEFAKAIREQLGSTLPAPGPAPVPTAPAARDGTADKCPRCDGTRVVRMARGEPSQGTEEVPCPYCPAPTPAARDGTDEPGPGVSHKRPDGTDCPYLAGLVCNKCGWTAVPSPAAVPPAARWSVVPVNWEHYAVTDGRLGLSAVWFRSDPAESRELAERVCRLLNADEVAPPDAETAAAVERVRTAALSWLWGEHPYVELKPSDRDALLSHVDRLAVDVARLVGENGQFRSLMTVPQPDGPETGATPESLRAYINELQDEWDSAEKRLAAARADVSRLTAERDAEREMVDKLTRFKTWVHGYLDDHGVPFHPPGTDGAEGCRIGDRMDWLMGQLASFRPGYRAAFRAARDAALAPSPAAGGADAKGGGT